MEPRKAKLVAKTVDPVELHMNPLSRSVTYYLTFEFEDKSREFMWVAREEFLLLAVGDLGVVTYRENANPRSKNKYVFKSFERTL